MLFEGDCFLGGAVECRLGCHADAVLVWILGWRLPVVAYCAVSMLCGFALAWWGTRHGGYFAVLNGFVAKLGFVCCAWTGNVSGNFVFYAEHVFLCLPSGVRLGARGVLLLVVFCLFCGWYKFKHYVVQLFKRARAFGDFVQEKTTVGKTGYAVFAKVHGYLGFFVA